MRVGIIRLTTVWCADLVGSDRQSKLHSDLCSTAKALTRNSIVFSSYDKEVREALLAPEFLALSTSQGIVSGDGSVPSFATRSILFLVLDELLRTHGDLGPIDPDLISFAHDYDELSATFHSEQRQIFKAEIQEKALSLPLSATTVSLQPYRDELKKVARKRCSTLCGWLALNGSNLDRQSAGASLNSWLFRALLVAHMAHDAAEYAALVDDVDLSTKLYQQAADSFEYALSAVRKIETASRPKKVALHSLRFRIIAGLLDTSPLTKQASERVAHMKDLWTTHVHRSDDWKLPLPSFAGLSTMTVRKYIGASCRIDDPRRWTEFWEKLHNFSTAFHEGPSHRPKHWPLGTTSMQADKLFEHFCAHVWPPKSGAAAV